jgi:tetratricopeptide (TPR) repeat protein
MLEREILLIQVMRDLNRHRVAIRRLRTRLRLGDSLASNNIAATYRELGNFRRAFQWWRRAAGPKDGDAWLEVGYCLQYGIGIRRDPTAAIRAYRRAIKTYYTTPYGCEEALYHLAVALLDRDDKRYRREIEHLLTRAAEDGDYLEAANLLRQVRETKSAHVCRCRRGLARRLGGKAQCPLHRSPRVRHVQKVS